MDLPMPFVKSESDQELHDLAMNDLLDLTCPFEQSFASITDESVRSKAADKQIRQYSQYLENEALDFERRALDEKCVSIPSFASVMNDAASIVCGSVDFSNKIRQAYLYDCKFEKEKQILDQEAHGGVRKEKQILDQEAHGGVTSQKCFISLKEPKRNKAVNKRNNQALEILPIQKRFLENYANPNASLNKSPENSKTEVQKVLNEFLAESLSDLDFGLEHNINKKKARQMKKMVNPKTMIWPKSHSNCCVNLLGNSSLSRERSMETLFGDQHTKTFYSQYLDPLVYQGYKDVPKTPMNISSVMGDLSDFLCSKTLRTLPKCDRFQESTISSISSKQNRFGSYMFPFTSSKQDSLNFDLPSIDDHSLLVDFQQSLNSTNSNYSNSPYAAPRSSESSDALTVNFVNGSSIYPIKSSDFKALMASITQNQPCNENTMPLNFQLPTKLSGPPAQQENYKSSTSSTSDSMENSFKSIITTGYSSNLNFNAIQKLIKFEHSYAEMDNSISSITTYQRNKKRRLKHTSFTSTV